MDFPSLLEYIEKLVEEPGEVTMQVYQQRTGVDQDKLKWLLTHQLLQVMSLNCVGDALSHVKSVKDDVLSRGSCVVTSDARVAVLVRATTSRVGWSSSQSWTGKKHHGGHSCSGKMGGLDKGV